MELVKIPHCYPSQQPVVARLNDFKENVTDLNLVGFDFAQPTLRHIKGFGDLTMLIERAIRL